MVAPAPGSTPTKKPSTDERPMTGAISRTSSRVTAMEPRLRCASSSRRRSASDLGFNTAISASDMAKVAMASSRKEMPSIRSMEPRVKRCTPCVWSVPTVESMRPNTVISSALVTWPRPANADTAVRPSTMSAK